MVSYHNEIKVNSALQMGEGLPGELPGGKFLPSYLLMFLCMFLIWKL